MSEQNRVQVDVLGRTNVDGVYAAGDVANPMRSIAASVAQGRGPPLLLASITI